MNPKLDSYLRHVFTAWITAAVVALTAWFTLDEKDVAAVTDGFGKIGEGVLIVLAVVVPALGRLAWAWLAQLFRTGSGEENGKDGGNGSGGMSLLLLGCTMAGMGFLPSCSSLRGVPVNIGIQGPGYSAGYSAKGGLTVQAVLPTK